jgi:glutamate racemase
VIACSNTALAAMLHDARERYTCAAGIPVVEVAIQSGPCAAVRTRNGRVGASGTVGTIDPAPTTMRSRRPHTTPSVRPAPAILWNSWKVGSRAPGTLRGRRTFVPSTCQRRVDTLVLGCTYTIPLASAAIQYDGEDVTLVLPVWRRPLSHAHRTLVRHGYRTRGGVPPTQSLRSDRRIAG